MLPDNFCLKGTQTGRFIAKEPTFSAVEQQIMAAMLAQYGAEALLKLMGLPYTKVQDSYTISIPKEKVEMTVDLLKAWEQLTKDEISLKLVNAWYENTKMQSYSQAKNSLQCYVNAALELQHTLSKIECANAILEETHNSNLARTCLNVKDI